MGWGELERENALGSASAYVTREQMSIGNAC